MKAVQLKTEYLKNPIGVDFSHPRFFWNCENGIRQTAYQILASNMKGQVLWNSGRIQSAQMTKIPYPGDCQSRERVIWKVKLWDEEGREGSWSDEAFFEMGLLSNEDWKAKWITGDYTPRKKHRYPVDCFRKNYQIEKELEKARLFITACGLYEAQINGQRVGQFVLAPGITDYRKRIQYQTYDVSEQIRQGDNTLAIQVADGWYRGSVGAWGRTNQYGSQTKLLAQLELTYRDGTREMICSDGSWEWSNDGPILFADQKDGEKIDANRKPSYRWKARETTHAGILSASNNVAVVEKERFSPQTVFSYGNKTLLNFGQNLAGIIEFIVTAKKGQKLTLRLGEMTDNNGELTLKNIQCRNWKKATPLQTVEYICHEGENHYKTKFAIFGFQFVEIETDVEIDPQNFTAIAIYSDMEQTGFFSCSDPLLNKFYENTVWSAKSNSADLPTDCPTRERHGWAGDAQVFFETAAYLFDYATFSKKYVQDLYDWQRKDGCLPQIAPPGGVDFYMNGLNGSVGWADAGVLIPYRWWKQYGDDMILQQYYDGMARYARFMMNRCGKRQLIAKPLKLKGEAKKYAVNCGQSYGEWAEPADVFPNKWTQMVFPHPEESTAYTCYVMTCMEEIAQTLGKTEDAKLYRRYAEGTRKAYQAIRQLPEFSLDTDRQARLVRPLAFGLLDEEQTEFAKKRLLTAMAHYDWRVGTGFLSTPFILGVLSEISIQYAYRLLENEKMPGWLFMPKNGATTVWEHWEGPIDPRKPDGTGVGSLNHDAKGSCVAWLFRTMCGIRIAGENHFEIAPRPGGHFSYARAEYNSVYGKVLSQWERVKNKIIFTIHVPPNTTAEIRLPGDSLAIMESGEYVFEKQV